MSPTAAAAYSWVDSARRREDPPAEALPILARIVLTLDAIDGPDIRPQARSIAQALVPDLFQHVAEALASLSPCESAPGQEIYTMYGELRELASAGDERRYRAALARLQDLQEAEARQMAAYFDANRPLRPDEAEAAISRAKALIAEHDNPPPPDAAARDAD